MIINRQIRGEELEELKRYLGQEITVEWFEDITEFDDQNKTFSRELERHKRSGLFENVEPFGMQIVSYYNDLSPEGCEEWIIFSFSEMDENSYKFGGITEIKCGEKVLFKKGHEHYEISAPSEIHEKWEAYTREFWPPIEDDQDLMD